MTRFPVVGGGSGAPFTYIDTVYPTDAKVGETLFRTDTDQAYVYTGSVWIKQTFGASDAVDAVDGSNASVAYANDAGTLNGQAPSYYETPNSTSSEKLGFGFSSSASGSNSNTRGNVGETFSETATITGLGGLLADGVRIYRVEQSTSYDTTVDLDVTGVEVQDANTGGWYFAGDPSISLDDVADTETVNLNEVENFSAREVSEVRVDYDQTARNNDYPGTTTWYVEINKLGMPNHSHSI